MMHSEVMLEQSSDKGSVKELVQLEPLSGCMTIKVSRMVSFVFFCFCFIVHLIAFATPNWYVYTAEDGDVSMFGLWTTCTTGFATTDIVCEKIHTGRPSQLTFEMRSLQTNMTLALISNVMTFIFYIVWFRAGRGKGPITYLTPGFNAFGGLTTIIAVSLFGNYFSSDLSILGWSFYVACISGGLQLLNGLITLFVVPCVRA